MDVSRSEFHYVQDGSKFVVFACLSHHCGGLLRYVSCLVVNLSR